jgi:hypothetical protein
MNPVEDRVHAAMVAAADLAAQEIRTAPPLRLPPEPAVGTRRRRVPRRWVRWVAPLAAAATVIALAISLVIVKGVHHSSAFPAGSASSTAGPGGAPRYFVALPKLPDKNGIAHNYIVVGDSLTGQTLATIAPPAHANFWSVTAAADDRTFIVEALSPARPSQAPLLWPYRGAGTIIASWFEVHLAPGTADPVRLTPLPIKQSWVSLSSMHSMYDPATTGVVSSAVSQSGKELAVLDVPAAGREEVKVFSLATGRLLHDWTTDSPSVRVPIQWVIDTSPLQALTWIDGDRALAFAAVTSVQTAPSTGDTSGEGTLRSLKVAGPARGDLLADSTPIWSGHLPFTASLTSCFDIGSWPEQISADGKTLSCGQSNTSHMAFVTNSLTAVGKDTIDYQLNAARGTGIGVLWTSASGDTLIGVWSNSYSLGQAIPLNFGVISHGTFTPLRFPSSLTSTYQPGEPFPVAF